MFYKFVNEYYIKLCPQNGVLESGEAISNLSLYFEMNPKIANKNGYYELVSNDMPEYDETKYYLKSKYSIQKNKIVKDFEIVEMPLSEEETVES